MTQRRRPALTPLVIRGLPRAMHEGSRNLPVHKSLDTGPGDRELRAAVEYLQKLYYWYMEVTMNFNYGIQEGRVQARRSRAMYTHHHTSYLPSPGGP